MRALLRLVSFSLACLSSVNFLILISSNLLADLRSVQDLGPLGYSSARC